MKVLVIDDEEGIRVGLKLALEDSHEVALATNAIEGIQTIQQKLPDVIVLDMFMEEGSGDQVLKFLEKEKFEISVIVISAFSTEVLEKKFGQNSTKWIHYRKPIDIPALRKLLKEIENKKGVSNGSFN